MFIHFLITLLSPQFYFTHSNIRAFPDTSMNISGNSISTYWTMDYKKNYFSFTYDNYSENWQPKVFRQDMFSLGYSREILHLMGIRIVGFHILDSYENTSTTLSTRLLYGYNPIYTLGYAFSCYIRQYWDGKISYAVHRINPELRFLLYKKIWIMPGVSYTIAESEKYFSFPLTVSSNILYDGSFWTKFNMEINAAYGKGFYNVDDRLLIINNRPDIEKMKIAGKIKYDFNKRIQLIGVGGKDVFEIYDITYCSIGLKINI
ncbi:MAG: hypothetical protein PHE49_04785 [bacterium]|nr:hypothetical protein [bacterium]